MVNKRRYRVIKRCPRCNSKDTEVQRTVTGHYILFCNKEGLSLFQTKTLNRDDLFDSFFDREF